MTLIDDSYNAIPDAVKAALNTMPTIKVQGRRIALLGKMGELGSYALQSYQGVGAVAGHVLDVLITVGSETEPLVQAARDAGLQTIYQVKDNQEAMLLLPSLVCSGDLLLIKGSFSANLKEVVNHFISSQ